MSETDLLYAILRTDFKPFVRKVFDVVSGDGYSDNWHIDLICSEIMDMIEGKNKRLIINIPPRNMKSIICSVALPAFLLGHNPATSVMCVSYNDNLAEKFASDCRRIMMEPWYQEMFPNMRIATTRRSISDFETTRGGGRISTSIGGTLTGRGADWIIIDDPLKPSDAMSDIQREKVNEWYGTTLCSRLNDKSSGKIILIMQRLHQHDLTGFLLESNSDFKHIRLPVIADTDETWQYTDRIHNRTHTVTRETGELLHPARENMDVICDIRRTQGEYVFAGQYQQLPAPAQGNLVKDEWLHFYNGELPSFSEINIACDTAAKTGGSNAYSAFVILGIDRTNRKIYLLSVHRERLEFPYLVKKLDELYDEYQAKFPKGAGVYFVIEDASSGTQLIQHLSTVSKYRGRVKSVAAESDKITRFAGASVYIENGTVLFPSVAGPWWPDFKHELLNFPSVTFKDQCDAFAHGVQYAWGRAKYGTIRCMVIG